MKFGATLAEQAVPEWAPAYVEYRRMKKKIKAMVKHAAAPTHVQKADAAELGKALLIGPEGQTPGRPSIDVRTVELKRMSMDARRSVTPSGHPAHDSPHVYDADEEEAAWFRALEHRADECNRFYEQRMGDFERRYQNLEVQVERLMTDSVGHAKARRSILDAFRELHSALDKLTNYCVLNLTAFSKLCKKYQRMLPWRLPTAERRVRELLRMVDGRPFAKHEALGTLRDSTERLFAEHFTGGDRRLAINRMRVVPVTYTEKDVLRLGLYLGACLPLAVVLAALLATADRSGESASTAFAVLRVYKGVAMLVLMAWLWAMNVWVFHRYHVNYRFIFELDVSSALEYHQLAELAAFLTLIWLASACSYVVAAAGLPPHPRGVPAYVHPLSLVLGFIMIAAWPSRHLFAKSRRWLARSLVEVALAPLFFVEFRHFFLGDQLTSNTRTLIDIEFIACFFFSGAFMNPEVDEHRCTAVNAAFVPVIAALPFWFRFAQCGRRFRDTKDRVHVVNAGKYFSGLLAVAMQTTHQHFPHLVSKAAWVGAQLAATLYSVSWDLRMDWGLLASPAGEHALLRPQLVYGPRAYYAAMVADALLRFTWIFSAWPQATGVAMHPEQLFLALQSAEICRRFMWNLFRLENEQLNNTGQFRAVRAIPLPYFVRPKSEAELDGGGGAHGRDESPAPSAHIRVIPSPSPSPSPPVPPAAPTPVPARIAAPTEAADSPVPEDQEASVRGAPPPSEAGGPGESPPPAPRPQTPAAAAAERRSATLARNRSLSSRAFHAIDPAES